MDRWLSLPRLLAWLLACLLVPAPALASPPAEPSVLDAPLLPPALTEPERSPVDPLRVGPPPPDGKHMIRAGMFWTIFGAITLAGGSAFVSTAWGAGEGYGIMGIVPLVFGGGFTTMGALLLHFGLERRWARLDWYFGRPAVNRRDAPRPGAGLLLAGPLTLAASATMFTWGVTEARLIGIDCSEDWFCDEGSPKRAAAMLASSTAGLLLGTTLTVLGARQRTRYIDWRRERGLPVELRPSGWANTTSFGLSLGGRF